MTSPEDESDLVQEDFYHQSFTDISQLQTQLPEAVLAALAREVLDGLARKLAERLIRENATDTERVNQLYHMLACRDASQREKAICLGLLAAMRSRYQAAEEDATRLLSTGDSPRDEQLNADEVAAWTQVAITVLASDVALMVY